MISQTLSLDVILDDRDFGCDIVGPKEGSAVADLLVPPVGQVEPLVASHPESVNQES